MTHRYKQVADRGRPRTQIPAWRKLLYTLTFLLLVLMTCEGLLRIRAWIRYGSASSQGTRSMYVYDQNLTMTIPQPGYELAGTNINIKINSLGFRGDEIEWKEPEGTIRIVCTGASTTFCEEATANDKTWPAQLQKNLRERFPDQKLEVINAGITGSAMISSLVDLRGRLLRLEPDLVILYRANNDIVLDTRKLALTRGLVQPEFSRRSGPLAILAKYSILAHLIRTNIDMKMQPNKASVSGKLNGIPQELPNNFIDILRRIHDELQRHDVRLLLSTFQVKMRPEQSRETQIANASLAFYHMPWATIEDLNQAFDTYNQAIVDFAASRSIPVVKDTNSIPADERHFADYMHFTDAGCAVMAKRFADFIQQSGLMEQIIDKQSERRQR